MTPYSELERAHRVCIRYGNMVGYGDLEEADFQEVLEAWHAFEDAVDSASIFLTDEQYETVMEAFL